MEYKGIQRKLKFCPYEIRVNTCEKPTSQYNLKNIDISDETLIETFSAFLITNRQFDYFFI